MKFSLFAACFLATGLAAGAATGLNSGIEKTNMDSSVRPQDDLYLAVNGQWLARTEIPADRSNYGSFGILEDRARDQLLALIQGLAGQTNPPGSEAQKVADLYQSYMDEKQIESLGLSPLKADLDAIDALKSVNDLAQHFGRLTRLGVQTPLGFSVEQDEKNSTQYLVRLSQSGTGLPDRDYYLDNTERYAPARQAYLRYIEKILTLSGTGGGEAARAAQAILALETQFAGAQRTRVELRDPEKNYNKMEVNKLPQLAPSLPWTEYFRGLEAARLTEINVGQPAFVQKAAELLTSVPLETWKAYLRFKLLDTYAIALPSAYENAHFELHGKSLGGVPEMQPRTHRAVELISGAGAGDLGVLGFAVGHLYVDRHFPPEAKARMDQLVRNLLQAYSQSIRDLTWMSPETKQKAQEKLAKYVVKIGYPDKARDYSALQIRRDNLIANLKASEEYKYNYELAKIGQPVDRTEWHMTPQTVNAYYNPNGNEIVFPAAILQPPFFNVAADDAANYGGIGAVIGHEISHGFDDQGSQYDGDGNLNNWWTKEDREAFEKLTRQLVAQYAAYEPLPGRKLNGELTLGENIADVSGVAIAYKAYRLSLQGKAAPEIDGWTGDQRFFLGWSQVWARKYREQEMARRLLVDPHSPSQFRANGAPVNSDAFHEAFATKPSDRLYKAPEERIRIW